jgi:hypothetical protein
MIALASDVLIFDMGDGESAPFSAEMISVELMGSVVNMFDADFVRHASHAVFHYFRNELRRDTVSVSEFAEALEKVLRGFVLPSRGKPVPESVLESDLCQLACESGKGCELFFFPRLRQKLQDQLQLAPKVLRFHGLRGCVKQLVGVRRWNSKCEDLKEQIVEYLRQCATIQPLECEFALVVE